MRKTILIAAVSLATLASTQAPAQSAPARAAVSYADLDLGRAAERARLDRRIAAAVEFGLRQLCRRPELETAISIAAAPPPATGIDPSSPPRVAPGSTNLALSQLPLSALRRVKATLVTPRGRGPPVRPRAAGRPARWVTL